MCDQSTYETGKRLIHTAIRIGKQRSNAQIRKRAEEARVWLRLCDGEAPKDYERRGKKAREHGMLEEAQSYYRKGLESRLVIAGKRANHGELRIIYDDYNILGDIAEELGKTEEAKKLYENGEKVLKALEMNEER